MGRDLLPCDGPLVVSYGAGVDSTAMLVLLHREGIRPDRIIFADVGSESPDTYVTVGIMHRWCKDVGFPGVTVVRYEPKRAPYTTLHGNCLANDTLPGLSFGPSSCSIKWKHGPLDADVLAWKPAKRALREGRRVIRAIGYDNSPADRKRFGAWAKREEKRQAEGKGENRWEFWYPLQSVWGLERPDLIAIIRKEMGDEFERSISARCCPKSACFFCPAARPEEVFDLARRHPDLALLAAVIEYRAETGKHGLSKCNGLGLTRTKADKGPEDTKPRNWSWRARLVAEGLLPTDWKGLAVRAGLLPDDWGKYANKVARLRKEIEEAEKAEDTATAAALKRAKKALRAPDWTDRTEPEPEHWEALVASVDEDHGPEFCHPIRGA